MKRTLPMILLLLALGLILTGCLSGDPKEASGTDADKPSSEEASSGLTVQAGDPGKKPDGPGPLEDPYLEQDFLALEKEGRISLSNNMNKISVLPDEGQEGVHFRGPASHFKGGRVSILGTFDFTGNPVGRISLSGITDSGHEVRVNLYLDDGKVPAAVFTLDHTDRENGWANGYTHTQNVYGTIPGGAHEVSFEIEIDGAKGNEETDVLIRNLEFAEDPGIPVLYFRIDESRGSIEDMNASLDHSVRCYGSLDIHVPDGFEIDYPGGVNKSVTDLAMDYLQGRGNSTWKDPEKKPYKFKLSQKTDLFGMGKNKNWALIANRFDNSLVRNRMTYWLGAALGMEYTSQCIPVEVVLNDEYYGSYLLAENVQIDESRVAIDELGENDTEEPAVTGGYLLAMNPYYEEDPRSVFSTGKKIRFFNEDPDFAGDEANGDFHGNGSQRDYIRDYVQRTEDAIYGEGFADGDGKGYAEYLDVDAAVDYWWVQEFSMNGDAYVTDSTRLYKKRDGKLYWGPLWDFDYVAWGNLDSPSRMRTEGFNYTETPWFDHLLTDPAFVEKLTERWGFLDKKISEICADGGLLDRYYQQMEISERYDREKHGFFTDNLAGGENDLSLIPGDHTYREEIDFLRTWMKARQSWVNAHLKELPDQVAVVTFKAFGEIVEIQEIRKGKRIQGIPEAPAKEGYFFTGWFTEDGEEADIWMYVREDITIEARYLEEESASKADHLFFRLTEAWADLNTGSYLPVYRTTPESALIHTVTWSSSDESIGEVTRAGDVVLKRSGTITVTGTLKSGYQAEYILHIYDGNEEPAVYCESLEPAEKTLTLRLGEIFQNPLVMYPEGTPLRPLIIAVSSDDPSVAVADSCCVVTGISPGTTTIRITDYNSDCTTSFEVTVLPEEGMLQGTDPASQALDMLMRLDRAIRPEDYTEDSYAAYAVILRNAADRLRNSEASFPFVIEELKARVCDACSRLNPISSSGYEPSQEREKTS